MFLKIPVILPAEKKRLNEDVKNGIEMAFANYQGSIKALPVYYLIQKIEIKTNEKTEVYSNHETILKNLEGVSPIVIAAVSSGDFGILASAGVNRDFILLTPTASVAELFDDKKDCFRNVLSNAEEAKSMSDFLLKGQGVEITEIVIFKTDDNKKFEESLKKQFNGVETVTKIPDINVNKKWVILIGEEKWNFIKPISSLKPSILTSSSIEDWRQPKEKLEIAKGFLFYTYPALGNNSANFFQDFRKEFGYRPSIVSALGFDAVNIAMKAITKGGYDYRAVRKVLCKEVFDDCVIGGAVCFDDNGEVIISGTIKEKYRGHFIIKTVGNNGQYTNYTYLI